MLECLCLDLTEGDGMEWWMDGRLGNRATQLHYRLMWVTKVKRVKIWKVLLLFNRTLSIYVTGFPYENIFSFLCKTYYFEPIKTCKEENVMKKGPFISTFSHISSPEKKLFVDFHAMTSNKFGAKKLWWWRRKSERKKEGCNKTRVVKTRG